MIGKSGTGFMRITLTSFKVLYTISGSNIA
jgi:hypothetical protein